MLIDVLSSVTSCEAVERVIVVTGERRAERIALRQAQRHSGKNSGNPAATTLKSGSG